ncbi:MAG: exodeoxyribonuclease III [Rhodospirillaceae bacterium]|jgi:exodeoxyribonuclease-3|nr:exodeoxyribonuclease III [Rhodospirillaceae bacterium]MBT5455791.1 exodeoxyribonuclease III [Rhodospirillaceae bacterium]
MRIVTWNINSLRLRLPTLKRLVHSLSPDVMCLQETKVQDADFPEIDVRALGFDHLLYRGMKSYNGVAILSRVPLKEVTSRRWCDKDDCRHIAAKLPGGAELHNFYVPAGGDIPDPVENDKFAHKLAFLEEMTDWFGEKRSTGRILVGDLNIAPLETDVWSHKQLLKEVSHTPVEVDGLNGVMAAHKWIDAVRIFVPPEEPLYSWWSYRNRTWPGSNRGRRLDHIWVTPPLEDKLRGASVFTEARGWEKPSDHAPVLVDIDL